MSDFRYAQSASMSRSSAQVDQGLRSYMLGVYNYMSIGLAITGLTAIGANMMTVAGYVGSRPMLTDFGRTLYSGPLMWVVALAPIGLILAMNVVRSNNARRILFFVLSALIGVSMSVVMIRYTGASVARVFFITAASFGALSLYGYTTKQSLSAMRSFLVMGLIGILIAMVVNFFLVSTGLQLVISVLGVLIFAGFTAYDTQAIKSRYMQYSSSYDMEYGSINGAVELYLDFINLFQFLMSLLGDRR